MSNDSPREWRINGAKYIWQKHDWCEPSQLDVDEQVHVIEYSAYEKLQAQLDEAIKTLQDIKSGCNGRAEIFGDTLRRCPTCASAETADAFLASLRKEK